MAPVGARHFSQSTNRYGNSRDYRSHMRFDDRPRRGNRYEKKRRSNSRSDQKRRDDTRRSYSKSSASKKQRIVDSDEEYNDLLKEENDPDKKFRLTLKRQNAIIKKTLAKSFGLRTSSLSKLLVDQCDEAIRDSILSKSKTEFERKSTDDTEPIQTSRVVTDEVHLCDEISRLDNDEIDEAPNNDYSQQFVNTGQRPQNYIRDAGLQNRFEEYPKLRELIRLKDDYIEKTNCPPMYLRCDLLANNFTLASLECEFDVILIEPPLEEYKRKSGIHFDRYVTWDEVSELDVGSVAAQRSFVFLWCGSAEGLDQGRICLKKWGFRRCEDICWVKTNRKNPRSALTFESGSIFQRTKEHCLMGIRGTVRRSVDSDFIHANVDIDLIITEEPEWGDPTKPLELYHIIEHFCLGRRRLHLFAREATIRRGWLSIGSEICTSKFDKRVYKSYFETPVTQVENLTERIEQLRPKSPPPKGLKAPPGATATTTSSSNQNSSATQQTILSTAPLSSNKDMIPSSALQDGQQAIRSTITSNRQSSSRAVRPHWGLYTDDMPPNVYPPMMLSPTRHGYPAPYSDLHLLSEYDFAIAGGNSSQNDYDTYYGHNNVEQKDDRTNFRYINIGFKTESTVTNGNGSRVRSSVIADFNNDYRMDIIIANSGSDNIGYNNFSFANTTTYSASPKPVCIAADDFNNDNKLDIVVANYESESVDIFLGCNNDSFTNQMRYSTGTGSYSYSVVVSDFNNDAFSIMILFSMGYGSRPFSAVAGDFNADTKLDLVVANDGTGNVYVF
ncbi:unnamed protein product [Rotaria magnacalcarata]|uniref:N(6)-adenosine-methyltransferase non-catalytic subunit METTL14 n=2 Tax=Rotaria magnacalcarata TaxID=392030 RepID=A0A814X487_9BILA|nr:unnamed protein product [Rotaria magnacalcarata]CAF1914260.1 unnamed protein product [Rotaria magnacalcarata]CAF3903521.1 unnamed protein product [Rotaria magnacalcarata]CAF3933370.1 unnamed protein product [Rotaria magnacalcarata]CAF3971610.1 unnamed protein product [Rotaria magnacalcarata]